MKKLLLASGLITFLAVFGRTADAATAYTFTGSGVWVCPAGVTSVQVECWGGGGAGGAAKASTGSGLAGGGGGGGGAYLKNDLVGVTPGNSYTVTVGAGGTSVSGTSTAGSASSFAGDRATVSANGGSPGTSEAANGFGTYGQGGAAGTGTSFAGGNGAVAVSGTGGGGGGSSAGNAATGNNGSTVTGGTAPAGGGSGGSGSSSSADGGAGSFPGGGGAGAYAKSTTQRNGGAGGGGQVVVTVNIPFAFTPGNLAVLLPGDSGANNTTLNILEVLTNAPGQTVVNSVAIDSSDAGGLHMSGSAGTSGDLADSGDGTLLAFTGANTASFSPAVNAIAARGVGTLDPAGNYVLQTTYTAVVSPTVQPRGASTIDNAHWAISDQGGMYTNGAVAPLPPGNFKAVKSFGGVNYVLTAVAGVPAVMTFSVGVTNYLPGVPADANATDFYLISSGQNGTTYDVLYLIDNTSATAGTLYKYNLSGGTWHASGTYATGLGGFGLCAAANRAGVNLYFTTGSGTTGNQVVQVTDTASPLNGPLAITQSGITLYTAPAGALLKGLALVPAAAAPTVATATATAIGATTATLNGSITYNGGAALTGYGFYWTANPPVTSADTQLQVGTSDYSGAYAGTLTGLSANTAYYFRAYAANSAGATLGGFDVSFHTLANTPTAPTVGSATTTSLAVTIGAGDGNPAGTLYAINETTTGDYVQADGSLGAAAVFQTAAAWGTVTVTGLLPATSYTFAVSAQNGAGVNTSLSAGTSDQTSTPPTPTISVSPDTLNFQPTLVGTTSANLTFTVSGVNLVGNLVMTAPANFQISTTGDSSFGGSVTLTPTGGTVPDTIVYVSFQPTAQTGYSGNLTTSSSGANDPNVALNGTGALAPSVSTQPANPTNTTSATLNGTVAAANGAAITDRGFYWSASPNVTTATGTQLDEGGTTLGAFSLPLTGLNPNTLYYFRTYAFNSIGFTLDSAEVVVDTLAAMPLAPVVGSPTAGSLAVAVGPGDGNPDATTYALGVTNLNQYVQANGSVAALPVFQTAAAWGTVTVTGLNPGTPYAFAALAQNSAGLTTPFGPATSTRTANAPFTPNNLAVLSAAVAGANNTTFSILELNPVTAAVAQTILINGTTGSDALRVSGSAGTAPKLADSGDGTLLVLAGFNSTNSSGTANTITNRAVATLDVSNNFTSQTTYVGISGNQVRNATTLDNHTWYVADAGGIYTNGDTTSLNTGDILAVKSFGGVVYALQSKSSTIAVSAVSPNGTALTGLPGLTRDSAAVDFCMISSGNNGSAYDVLYILDETSATAGAVKKYSLAGGTWASGGSYATTFGGYGLAVAPVFGGVGASLYVTTGDGTVAGNSLEQLTDTADWNSPITIGAPTLLYTVTGGATLKGIARAPVPLLLVTNPADSGPGTLRQVIANAYADGTITFAPELSGATLTLASPLTLNTNLAIAAFGLPGGLQINGNQSGRLFNVLPGNTVVLDALTLVNGNATSGGAINNAGALTVNECTLEDNSATAGAGIYNTGTLTVNQCTLSANVATYGAAIDNESRLTVNQSTLAGNTANGGGTIFNDGAAALTLFNSIVAGNSMLPGADLYNVSGGVGTFAGTNLLQDLYDPGSGMSGIPPINAAPLLTLPGNHGGPTPTMAPTRGSPGIGACTANFYYDQRGFPRLSTTGAAIGSVGYGFNPSGAGWLGGSTFTPAAGSFEFGFTNFTFLQFTVLASTNLTIPGAWVPVGTAVESPSGSGHYQFTDTPSPADGQRFYEVTSP